MIIWLNTGLPSLVAFLVVNVKYIQRVNELNCGISIGDKHFNIFCYDDDILLASTIITGLQVMIDVSPDYVEAHGLKFNESKTNWTIKGKPPFISEATLMLNGTTLTKEDTIKYLGTILGNDGSATHAAQRIKAANGSYFKLQALHGGRLSPDAIRHLLYKVAVFFVCLSVPPIFFRHDRRTATKFGTHIRVDMGLILS